MMDARTERSMRRAARLVLDTPGMIEQLAQTLIDETVGLWLDDQSHLEGVLRRTCEELAARDGGGSDLP